MSASPKFMPGRSYAAHISVDVAAVTAWATCRTNENMRRRQLEPSQSFTADMRMPAKLNSSHLHRHAGGKDWDDQCCRPLQFSYRNSIPGRFQAVPAAMSQAPSSNKRPSPPPSLSLIVRMHGKPSLRANSSITANEASCERTRSSHSRLLSRAVVAWLLATLPNEETKTCFYCHFIDNLVCKSYNGTKVVTWLPTGRT